MLPSCREGRQKAVTNAEIVAKVDVSESNKCFDVDQIADFEKVIPIETVGDALVGEIDKLEMDDNHIVILDKRMRTVWLFGIDGKFIRRIGMVQRNMSHLMICALTRKTELSGFGIGSSRLCLNMT